MAILIHVKEFLKKNRFKYLLGVILLIAVDVIQLIVPLLQGEFIDYIESGNGTVEKIVFYALGIIGLTLAVALGRFGWRVTIIGVAKNLEYYIRNRVFKKLTRMNQTYYNSNKTGDIMARCTNDINTVRRAFGQGTILVVDSFLMALLAIVLMITKVSLKLTLIALIPLPVVAITIFILGKTVGHRFKAVQEAFSDLSDKAQESFAGIRIIKSFVQEKINLHFFNESNSKNLHENLKLVKVHGLLFPFVSAVAMITLLITIFYGGSLVINQEISLGELVSFIALIRMMTWPMMALGFVFTLLQRGKVSLERINEILDDKEEVLHVENGVELNEFSLEVNNLTLRYPEADVNALENISFKLKEGESLAIVGHTGSGKSSLVEQLLKTYPVEDGTIKIGGRDINSIDLKSLRSSIGYVPQSNFLFSKTINENIGFNSEEIDVERSAEMSKISMVYKEIEALEKGFDTELGERGVNLSGGQKQRISIARAFYKEPEIIILDDSLSAVDTKTEDRILHHIREELRDKTAILISHRVSTVKDADKIIVLEDGKIIEEGNHDSLIEEGGYYYGLYEKQLLEEKILEE